MYKGQVMQFDELDAHSRKIALFEVMGEVVKKNYPLPITFSEAWYADNLSMSALERQAKEYTFTTQGYINTRP